MTQYAKVGRDRKILALSRQKFDLSQDDVNNGTIVVQVGDNAQAGDQVSDADMVAAQKDHPHGGPPGQGVPPGQSPGHNPPGQEDKPQPKEPA